MVPSFLEKVYAGFLGMNIGIRLGAPVEPGFWSYERIREVYDEIKGYIKSYSHFAADDDVNGPVFFLRALDDSQEEPSPQHVAEAWLNYAREGVGMYWWGGYGVSTEHTAYLNLKHGVPAPQSGSIRQNGRTLAEQIGGQIFIDTWGLICPGDPERAARYAVSAASVSHDGEGLHGAAFMAACIAQAFVSDDIQEVVAKGLAQIPRDSLYAQVVEAVADFHGQHPEDWRACRAMLEAHWGYDRYPGICHMIPNAGVCALSLLYGAGDFARTVEIATMCSWDTDCNAGNVGTIVGVAAGLAGIPPHYRDPLEDELVLSGISGYLNVLDIPTYVKRLAQWAYRLKGLPLPAGFERVRDGEILFDFRLPGATHSLKYKGSNRLLFRRSRDRDAVEVVLDRAVRGQGGRVYYRSLWRRADFDDERYMPVFSPTAYPGQTVKIDVAYEKAHGEAIQLTPYVIAAVSGRELRLRPLLWRESVSHHRFSFVIPELDGDLVQEIGLHIESASPARFFDGGRVLIERFHIDGAASYRIGVGQLPREFDSVLGFSHNLGAWSVEDGALHCLSYGQSQSMTGSYYTADCEVTGWMRPENGGNHLVSVHVQGARRGYYGGLVEGGKASIFKNRKGALEQLVSCDYSWTYGENYEVSLAHQGGELILRVNGQFLLRAQDEDYAYGMAGYAVFGLGRCRFGDLTIIEKERLSK